jgi:hypothetical protein
VEEGNTETGVRKHLSDKETWLRLIYMILFGIAFEVVKFVTFFIAAIQILFKLFTGDVQPKLVRSGAVWVPSSADRGFPDVPRDVRPDPWRHGPSPSVGGGSSRSTTVEAAHTPDAAAGPPRARRRRKNGSPGGEAKSE